MIISILESYLENRSRTIETLKTFYPPMEVPLESGKKRVEYPNRYFIMHGEEKANFSPEELKAMK